MHKIGQPRTTMRKAMLIAVVLALLLPAGGQALQPGHYTISISDRRISVQHPHTGHTIFRSLLYNKQIRARAIGSSVMLCTFLGREGALGDGASYCWVSYSLPKGTIHASGVVRNHFRFQLAVTGGTGWYANIVGTTVSLILSPSPPKHQLQFAIRAV